MKRFLLVVLSGLTSHTLFAQVIFPNQNTEELNRPEITRNLSINQDPRLEKMLNWHIENNKINNKIDGFRVEIFFSSDFDAKDKALKLYREIKNTYPVAFIVTDEIDFPLMKPVQYE